MVAGGDVLLPTPLAAAKAPWVWLGFAAWAPLAACLPLVWVFRNPAATSAWVQRHGGRVPWAMAHPWLPAAGAVLLWLCFSLAFWISRGGHEWKHRITVEILFYAALALWGAAAVPVAWGAHAASVLLLGAGLCVDIVCTVFIGIALPWYAGAIGGVGCLAWAALLWAWAARVRVDEPWAPVLRVNEFIR